MNWKIDSENYSSSTENSIKKNEYSLRDGWENIKNTNIHIIGSQKDSREKGTESLFERIIAENFANWGVQFSCSVVSDFLRPHGLQDARPSPAPGTCSNSYP